MSFVRKKQDIFGLTLDDSIWRNQEKLSLLSNDLNDPSKQILNQNLTSGNVSPVKQKLKQDNSSCFQYGFPSLFELNEIHSHNQSSGSFNQREIREIKLGFSDLGIRHIITNHKEISKEKSILKQDRQNMAERSQENKQFHSLFQYDLLFNKMINKEKSVTQSCPCCPPLDLSSCETQQQKDLILIKRDDISYIRPIGVKHIPERPSSDNELLEANRKPVQPGNSLKDVNNNSVLNKLMDEKLNAPDKVNHLNSNNILMKTKPDDEKFNGVTRPIDKIGHSVSLKDTNKSTDTVNKPMNERLNDFKSKSQPSTLTVEKVQSILEFYHSTSKDFTFEKKNQDNIDYSSDDEKESLSDIEFFDISNIKLFKCAQCDKEFPDKNSREKHVRNDHKFICKICNKVLFHVRQMQLHEEKVHEIYIKNKPNRRGSRQTKRKRNPDIVRTYFCCGQTFKTGREFGIHKSTHKSMVEDGYTIKNKVYFNNSLLDCTDER
ncbi:hypothetical protein C1645_819020 [Glomus cerebriforme]|uniref:C2H2-type domain-containing protein n=1 Tax=Glomus cerebriforme TaxID=658196 RepID=A0A397TFS6_9GLOM|nr:hypothetical protein C1645_819020 [Glomus cerebriforme]